MNKELKTLVNSCQTWLNSYHKLEDKSKHQEQFDKYSQLISFFETNFKTTPEEIIKAIKALKAKLDAATAKPESFTYTYLKSIDAQLAELEIRLIAIDKKDKTLIDQELKILDIALNNIEELIIRNGKSLISKELESSEKYNDKIKKNVAGIITATDDSYNVMKTILTRFDKKANLSSEESWNKLKAEVEAKNKILATENEKKRKDLGQTAIIDYDLSILHHKGRLDFDKKNKDIETIEKEAKHEFAVVIDEASDLDDFKAKWNVTIDKKIKKSIAKFLKKEEKKELETYFNKLSIAFKKVEEDDVKGWVVDREKTKAPAEVKKEEEASLSIKPELTISEVVFENKVFRSTLVYKLNITRKGFKYQGWDAKKFAEDTLEQGGEVLGKVTDEEFKPKTEADLDDITGMTPEEIEAAVAELNKEVKTNVTVEVITQSIGLVGNVLSNFKEITIKDKSAILEWKFSLKSGDEKLDLETSSTDSLDSVEFKKKHLYQPNSKEASSAFEEKVKQELN